MSSHFFDAEIWSSAPDQYGRLCWYSRDGTKATYDPPHPSAIFQTPSAGCRCNPYNHCPPPPPPPQQQQQQQHGRRAVVVIVGDRCKEDKKEDKKKEDKWEKFLDCATGAEYYHNWSTKESTWDKPDGFDEKKEKKKECKPPPPTTKPPRCSRKCGKYCSCRKSWL